MPLDPEQLRRDVEVRRAERGPGVGPNGKPRTGAMAAVRRHLDAIEALHDEGATWVDIAAGLTAQGIVRGDGSPLTGRHLTALIASIRRQRAGHAAASARRAGRADLRQLPATPAVVAEQARSPDTVAPGPYAPGTDTGKGGDSATALFQRIDQKARDDAEEAAQRPDFSKGLLR